MQHIWTKDKAALNYVGFENFRKSNNLRLHQIINTKHLNLMVLQKKDHARKY